MAISRDNALIFIALFTSFNRYPHIRVSHMIRKVKEEEMQFIRR